ncbi:hypothetical protein [Thiomicrorhabdus xiamenensis]|uniref:SIR2-like domain-containing protein n=1 Tax=Thiomicrorhabdus xiamenensis TaxID=2739063 RepID=A0A7D4TGF2_9GAMM|nr:hypothetical protein [Thiomicrorhabdus xiamenensis]QKI89628.1 hypothetical protein HQN79_08625 [Thiomicrorhabdus xiamenensis]
MSNSCIPLSDIYQQKINFIIGSGASHGLFPTLWLPLKDSNDETKTETLETLATKLEQGGCKNHLTLLFMYYFRKVIEPAINFNPNDFLIDNPCERDSSSDDCLKRKVLDNYETFIDSIVRLLQQKSAFSRRCNVFTTNYDGCIPFVADYLLKKNSLDFVLNDGATGFLDKTLSAKNFSNYVCRSGVFGKNSTDIPQINLINLHGSAYWRKSADVIKVDYSSHEADVVIPESVGTSLAQLDSVLNDATKNTRDVLAIDVQLSSQEIESFWNSYNQLPIVNPTKWKFHETVFEEHYYQMLRLLSYQLEEANSVLISFAFSFADEHILNLVKRSLSNPKLKVYICCFNDQEKAVMHERFKGYRNVELIALDGKVLDFDAFNETVFNADLLRDGE